MEGAVLLDATVAIHALSEVEPMRSQSREFLRSVTAGRGRAYASVEMIQEVVHHRLRRTGDRANAVRGAREFAAATTTLKLDHEVLELALELIERLPAIRGRDAVHAATALAYGIEIIASSDRAFDHIPGITRIDPLN